MPWDQTEEYIRSGHRNHEDFEEGSFRTIDIDRERGIKAIIGKLKGEETTAIQSFLFLREKGWTLEKAKDWFENHVNRSVSEGFKWIHPIYGLLKNILTEAGGRLLKIVATHADIRNRNNRVYSRDELIEAARTLSGKKLSINHKTSLSSSRKVSLNGIAFEDNTVLFSQYEDGRLECVAWVDEQIADRVGSGELVKASPEGTYFGYPSNMNVEVPSQLYFTGLALLDQNNPPGDPLTQIILDSCMKEVELLKVTESVSSYTSTPVSSSTVSEDEEVRKLREESMEKSESKMKDTEILEKLFEEQRRFFKELTENLTAFKAKKDELKPQIPIPQDNSPSPEEEYVNRMVKLAEDFRRGFSLAWTIPIVNIPSSPLSYGRWLQEEENRIKTVRETLSTSAGGLGQRWVTPLTVLPADLPAALRSTAQVVQLDQGQDRANFVTITTPSAGALTENTEPTEASQTITTVSATPSPRGWQQSVSYELRQKITGDILDALSQATQFSEVVDEDSLMQTALNSATPAAILYGDESVASESAITSTMTFKAARLASGIREITKKGYNPFDLICVLHPVQYDALLKDTALSQYINFGDSSVIQKGIIPNVYGVEVRASTKTPTGTGSGGITTYHAHVYKKNVSVGVGISRDITLKTFDDIRKNQYVFKASWDLATAIIQPNSIARIITA